MDKSNYKIVKQRFFLQKKSLLVFFASWSNATHVLNKFILNLELELNSKLEHLKFSSNFLKKALYKHSF